MSNFKMQGMKGVISAMISVFDENEDLNLEKTRDLVEFQLKNGVEGFYITGSTGEGFLMTQDERNAICDVVVDQVAGRVPVIVHVGDIGTKKSIDLAKHAYEAGADGIIGSFYNAMPETFVGIFSAVKNGDTVKALRLQTIATEIILESVKYDYFSVIRHMISWQGVDAGYSRRPFKNYTSAELIPLKEKFAKLKAKYNITNEEVHFMEFI